MPILTFTTSGQVWTTIGKSKLYFPGAGVQSLLLWKERGEKRRSKGREDRKEKPEVGGTFLIMSPEMVWFCEANMIDWSLEGKEPMGLETWITKLLCILCVLMERSFGTKPGILVSHISNALICVAKACGWLPRDFVSSSTTWEAGKIGLQGPFSFAHSVNCSGPLHCYVQLALIVVSVRRNGEKGQAPRIRLDALLRGGPICCTVYAHLEQSLSWGFWQRRFSQVLLETDLSYILILATI